MRLALAALFTLLVASSLDTAKADPYRWCADYGGRGGGTNCYFLTLSQCRAAISGNGGFCRVNGFYTGRDTGDEDAPRRRRIHRG